MNPQYFIYILTMVLLGSSAQLLFRKGALSLNLSNLGFSLSGLFSLILQILHNVWLMIGIFLFVTCFFLYIFILSKIQLNIVYPIFVSAVMVVIPILSWMLFKEPFSLNQFLGLLLILSGIFFMFLK
mgnify:FL=1